MNEVFIGICKEKNHCLKLGYFCTTHNQLCCPACIAKIKYKGYGKHKDYNFCTIKKIKKKKKKNLEENIKNLEDLSNNIEQTINELKNMLENINKNKEKLKSKIQLTFTKMRNEINKREDELLLEIDKKFDELFFDERIVKESEKLHHEIKIYLEKGKKINDEWEDKEKLSSIINDCNSIENLINDVNNINDIIKNCKEKQKYEVKLKPNEDELEEYLKGIKDFGEIYYNEKVLKEENDKEKEIEEEKKKKKNI